MSFVSGRQTAEQQLTDNKRMHQGLATGDPGLCHQALLFPA